MSRTLIFVLLTLLSTVVPRSAAAAEPIRVLFVVDGAEPEFDASVERALEAQFQEGEARIRILRRTLPPALADQAPLIRGLLIEHEAAGGFWLGPREPEPRKLHFVTTEATPVVTRTLAHDGHEPVAESIALIVRWTVDALLHDEPLDAPLPAPTADDADAAVTDRADDADTEEAPSPDPPAPRTPTFMASEDLDWEPPEGDPSPFDPSWSETRFEFHVGLGGSGYTSRLAKSVDPGFQFRGDIGFRFPYVFVAGTFDFNALGAAGGSVEQWGVGGTVQLRPMNHQWLDLAIGAQANYFRIDAADSTGPANVVVTLDDLRQTVAVEGLAVGPMFALYFRVPIGEDTLLLLGPRIGWRGMVVASACVPPRCTSNTIDQGMWDAGLVLGFSSGI